MNIDVRAILQGRSQLGQGLRMVLLALLTSYLFLNLCAYFFAERLIFQPPVSTYQDTPEIIKLTTQNRQQISALYLSNSDAKFTILYSHGNGSDLGTIRPVIEIIRQIGFSVLAYDYQGYGTSQGYPSEQNTYQDVEAAYHYLTQTLGIPPARILLYGFSVGSGPSLHLATRHAVAGVILEGAFTSVFRVVTYFPLLLFDRFPNLDRIRTLRQPLLIIHGTQDRVIPFHHGKTLYQQANPPKQFLPIAQADHNNLIDVAGDRYEQALKNFAQQIEQKLYFDNDSHN